MKRKKFLTYTWLLAAWAVGWYYVRWLDVWGKVADRKLQIDELLTWVSYDKNLDEYLRIWDFEYALHSWKDPNWIFYEYKLEKSDLDSPKSVFDAFNAYITDNELPIKPVWYANIKLDNGTRATPWWQQRWKQKMSKGDIIYMSSIRTDREKIDYELEWEVATQAERCTEIEVPYDDSLPPQDMNDFLDMDWSSMPYSAKEYWFDDQLSGNIKQMQLVNYPTNGNKRSIAGRIVRCMRWRTITEAVESRYNIPQWLLLAMMAQEWLGDPTMPNLSGDGGLGLLHIQWANAKKYGMKTLPTYTSNMRDTKHGQRIDEALTKYDSDMARLIEADLDDRFHPVAAVERAGAFLLGDYKSKRGTNAFKKLFSTSSQDQWVDALRIYSGRAFGGKRGYGEKVFKYRYFICRQAGYPAPQFKNKAYSDARDQFDNRPKTKRAVRDAFGDMKVVVRTKKGKKITWGSDEYYAHYADVCKDLGVAKLG